MSRLTLTPVNPKAAVITNYSVRGLPDGEGRVAMQQSGSGWGYCWMRPWHKVGALHGSYATAQEALRALEKEVNHS